MTEDPHPSEYKLAGDDIIAEILHNSQAGEFKIRQMTLVPAIYRVYLHPADYDAIRRVIPALTAETRAALIERLEELNRKSKPSTLVKALGFDSGKTTEYRILDPDWTIEFLPDAEDKLKRGDIEVFSELASAPQPEFDGAMTRHVTRRRADPPASPPPSRETADAPTRLATTAPAGPVVATIRYTEGSEAKAFEITKNQIVIGRGGKAFWVDLKLNAPPDVSREHCRIRRDVGSGKFYIKDTSQYGTSVNGKAVPPSIDRSGGEEHDKNIEIVLPDRATISLADVITLEFETA